MATARMLVATFAAMLFLLAGRTIAAAQTSSAAPPQVTVLGPTAPAARSEEGDNGGVTVLRGPRPVPAPAAMPPLATADECPAGYVDSGPEGCVPQGYAEEPIYDLSWPFFVRGGRRRYVRHTVPAFVHRGAIPAGRSHSGLSHR